MGNYLTYKDVPIFANFESENENLQTYNSSHIFAATEASINLTANLVQNRYLGKIQAKNDFSANGPLEAKISMTFFPIIETLGQSDLNISRNNQLCFFNTTGEFVSGHVMQIGNYFFCRTYLQNYSMKINAFQPISVNANFISYDISSIEGNSFNKFNSSYLAINKNANTTYYKALHAITTTMDGDSSIVPTTKTSVQINVDTQRTPIYNIGSKIPSCVVLNTVERTITVEGEDIGSAISFQGKNAGSTNIYFQPFDNTNSPSSNDYVLKFDINGKIISQELSIPQNGIVNGRVVIKEIIL